MYNYIQWRENPDRNGLQVDEPFSELVMGIGYDLAILLAELFLLIDY